MRRSPLQLIGDVLGMYAYLAAMGGLQYWPALREASIVEIALSDAGDVGDDVQVISHELDPVSDSIPAR